MSTTHRPLIAESDADVDLLTSYPTVEVAGRDLRSGMVLVDDDLDCPVAILDSRNGRAAKGAAPWLVMNLDDDDARRLGRYATVPFLATKAFRVAAEAA